MSDVALWNTPAKPDPIPGIDYAAVHYYLWDDRVVFALWADNDSNDGGSTYGEFHCDGSVVFRDGRPSVKYDCRTSDGKSGALTVNNQKFELSEGSLILVDTSGGTVRMKQLQREGLAVLLPNGTREGFQKWKTDPEIAEFFAQEKKAK